jgi:peroxisome proliferator-activated receptor gamma coactivator-related protein 1
MMLTHKSRSYRRRTSQPTGNTTILHSRSKKRRFSVDYNDDIVSEQRGLRSGSSSNRYRRGSAERPSSLRRPEQQPEKQRQVDERRVVYVGGIAEGTLKADLRQRFEAFGPILDISLHFRERGNNYGFVTFKYQADAYEAVEHGNDDGSRARYELSFGGRRAFCKEKYFDMDDVEEESGGDEADLGFDELLRRARGRK